MTRLLNKLPEVSKKVHMSKFSNLEILLGIQSPWQVVKHAFNPISQRLDVWIATISSSAPSKPEKSNWFDFGTKTQTTTVLPAIDLSSYSAWQHQNMAAWQVYVHSPLSMQQSLIHMPWAGEAGQHFSRAMSRQIFGMMEEGASLSVICSALNVSLTDLWKFKLGIDKGTIGIQAKERAPRVIATPVAGSLSETTASHVPSLDNLIWIELASGTLNFEVKTLSLRLLLTKIKAQFRLAMDDEVRALHIRELHRYFEKNQRALGHELAQLKSVI